MSSQCEMIEQKPRRNRHQNIRVENSGEATREAQIRKETLDP